MKAKTLWSVVTEALSPDLLTVVIVVVPIRCNGVLR